MKPSLDSVARQIASFAVHRPWLIILGAAILALVTGAGLPRLTFNNDTRAFFSERNPQLEALEALENVYTKDDNLLFIVAPHDGEVFTRDTLEAVAGLTAASWQLPYSSRVDSITNFQHTRAEGDDLRVEDLVPDAATLSDAALRRIRAVALAEPLLVDRLVSPAGHVTGVNVNVLLPGLEHEEVGEVAARARALRDAMIGRYPAVDFHLTGAVMMDNGFGEAGRDDLTRLAPVMLLVLIAIVGLALGSVTGTFATLTVIVLATTTAMGVAGWLGIALTPASVAAPTIILTLAVADSVHLLETLLQELRLGCTRAEAVTESLRGNLRAVFLTSITTVIGFLSMNLSDAPPFRDLGNIVAIGVGAAFLYSVALLPALMTVLPLRVEARAKAAQCPPCDGIAKFTIRWQQALFYGSILVIFLAGLGIFRIELNDDWMKYFDRSYDFRRATDFMEENLTGADIIEYSLESGEAGGINDPAYLASIDTFANWYRSQPRVVHVQTIADTMKRLNRNMHADDESWYRLPGQRDLAAQYLLLYELSLPFGLDLNNRIDVDKSASRMVVILENSTTRDLRETEARGRAWLQANSPELYTYGSGLSVIWAHLSGRNITAMLGASLGALLLISALLVVAFGSLRVGLVSLIPNLAPALMAFGIWGLLVGRVGLGLSVVVSMTLGVVVDDTVHFISKYLRARRERGMEPAQAVCRAFHKVGTAMSVTTVALVAGFLVLTLSGYTMSVQMGMMSALTIALALALDFLFLPVLLLKLRL